MPEPTNADELRETGAALTLPHLRRTGLSLLLVLALAACAVRLLGIRLGEVVARVSATPPLVLAGCVASAYVVLALQTLRWHQVMRPVLGLRYGEAFCAQIVGVTINALLPARCGDLLRAQYLGRVTGRSRATILGTEVVDRWLDWWGWIPVVAVLAMTCPLPASIYVAASIFGGVLFAGAIAIVLVCNRRTGKIGRSRLAEIAEAFRAGLDAFASRRTLALALLVAPLPWLWEAGVLAVAGRAFDVRLTFPMAFCVLVGFNAATVVPSPGGVGAVETGGAAALVLLGVDRASALAFLVVYHLTQLLPAVAGGAALLALRPRSLFAGLGAKR